MAGRDRSPAGRWSTLRRISGEWAAGSGSRFSGFLQSGFVRKIILPILVLAVALKVLMWACITYVGPNEYGIKVVRVPILGARGVHKDVYDTGFHVVLQAVRPRADVPLPARTCRCSTSRARARRRRARRASRKPAHIQTSDGFFVDVDVSILYRIVDPYLVFTRLGPGALFETNGIVPKAEPVLKQTLGELTTEEFYNSPLRVAKAQLAHRPAQPRPRAVRPRGRPASSSATSATPRRSRRTSRRRSSRTSSSSRTRPRAARRPRAPS